MSVRGRGGGEGVRTRDHLASVRTALAWVRTGLVLMGIGYAMDKLAALERLRGVEGPLQVYGHDAGLLVVGAGVVVTAAALPRFLRARARVESGRFEPHPGADLALVGALAAGGLAFLVLVAVAR
jgi:putative membrane protein